MSISRGQTFGVVLVLMGSIAQGCGILAGLDDFHDAPDGGTGGGNTCLDGARQAAEDCDGNDLAGADCISRGYQGGTLVCSSLCTFDDSGCVSDVSAPVLRSPANGARVGTVKLAGSMRPTFRWQPSTAPAGMTITYTLQYSADPNFVNSIQQHETPDTQFVPAEDLPAQSQQIPYGTLFYWRVMACIPSTCSPWSSIRRLHAGRSRRDYTGEGYADVLAGGISGNGQATLVYGQGKTTIDMTADATAQGEANGDKFGRTVASAGDVNADGFADILVGAPGNDAVGGDKGRVYLYRGGSENLFTAASPWILEPKHPDGVSHGRWAAGLGDVNGDGFDDIGTGKENWGCASIFLGGSTATMDGKADYVVTGQNIAAAGDVNGDGFDDVVTSNKTPAGEVRLYYGSASMKAAACMGDSFATGIGNDGLGTSLSSGDINGDGFSDLIIGASDPVTKNGYVQIWFGGTIGPSLVATLAGPAASGFGSSVTAGDLNGDGYADVIVGAPAEPTGGRVHIFKGAPGETFDTTEVLAIDEPGAMTGDNFGTVASGGDVNGDGLVDLVVGASAPAGSGAIFLYLGKDSFSLPLAGSAASGSSGNQYGISVAWAWPWPRFEDHRAGSMCPMSVSRL